MQCTSPLIAVWTRPDIDCTLLDGFGFDVLKPRILGRYKDWYESVTPSRLLHLPLFYDDFLRYIKLPCGKCDACRLARSSEWSYRCRMEQLFSSSSSFITLTCSDEFLGEIFPNESLSYRPFQLFLKRLREKITEVDSSVRIRFLMCGEYGSIYQRPHYHALIFGWDFPDRYLWRIRDGVPVYRSPLLESVWTYGFCTVGEMVPETINYVCRYVMKKLVCRVDYGDRQPEFIRMSNRPGIGAKFFADFVGKDFYKRGLDGVWYRDYIMFDSYKMKPPRYYDKLFERLHSADFVSLRLNRFLNADSVFAEHESDLSRKADYLKCITKGRIKKENFVV